MDVNNIILNDEVHVGTPGLWTFWNAWSVDVNNIILNDEVHVGTPGLWTVIILY